MKLTVALALGAIVTLVGCGSTQPNKQHIQVNNEMCPVTGNRVNDKDTYIYKGKAYKLCSGKCKQALSENPEKYLPD